MAVWSHISTSDLAGAMRLDAEFWQPTYLAKEKSIRAGNHVALGDLVSTFKKGVFYILASEYSDEGIPFYRSSNVGEILPKDEGLAYITPLKHKAEYKTALAHGDLMMVKTGRSGASVVLAPQCNVSQDVIAIKVRGERVNPYFLALYLNTSFGSSEMNRWFQGQVQPHLSLDDARRILIALLPDATQLEIENLVKKSARLRTESVNAQHQASALFEAELGLDKLTFKMPVGYVAQASDLTKSRRADAEYYNPVAREIVRRIKGLRHTTLRESFEVGSGFPWRSSRFVSDNSGEPVVRIRNVKPHYIVPNELTSIQPEYANSVGVLKARRGDVVVGMDGIKYFYASILEGECFVNQRVCHLSPRPSSVLSSEYVAFVINSVAGQAQLMRDMTVATTVGHITNRDVAKLIVPTIGQSFHDELTALIRKSIDCKEESKRLLEQAKARVEKLIEEVVRP
jgi:type I restriction enzyme S subunit